MDGTANELDVEGLEVQGFPTIYFFKGGDKTGAKPVAYEGEREVAGFVAFLKENAAHPIGELAEKAAAAAPAAAAGEPELDDFFDGADEGDFDGGDEYGEEDFDGEDHEGHDHDDHDEL
jgi:hypothetical protein